MSINYVNNKELLEELKAYLKELRYNKENHLPRPKMNENLGEMIYLIATNLAKKPNFSNYTYKEDFIGEALLTVMKYIKNFDPEKSKNPFAYITLICHNAFLQYIAKQKKHSIIKDECFNAQEMFKENTKYKRGIDYTIVKK